MNQKQIKIPLYMCLGILIILGIAAVRSLFDKPVVLTNVERIREIRDDSISYWKDRYGDEHAQRIMASAELAIMRTEYAPLVDSVLERLRINGKQLQDITTAGIASQGRVRLRVDTVFVDSNKIYQFTYNDRWLDLNGSIGVENSMDYTTRDSLVITGYIKKRGFLGLGRKETYIDAYSLNPHSYITGLQGLRITTERSRRWGIGPFVGYGYDGAKWAPFFGVGLQYSVIKF